MTNLRKLRQNKNLTTRQLSEKTGITFRMIQHYDSGRFNFDNVGVFTMLKLATALDCKLSDLLDGDSKNLALKYENMEK